MPGFRETLEEHPYIVAGSVFVVGVILIWYFLRGSGSAAAPDNSSFYAAQAAAVQSGNALQAAQIAGQVTVSGFQAAVNREALDTSAAISLAQIAANQASHEADVASTTTLGTANIAATFGARQLQTTDLSNNLAAQVATHAIDAEQHSTEYGATQQTEQQRILSAAMVTNHAADIGLVRDYMPVVEGLE